MIVGVIGIVCVIVTFGTLEACMMVVVKAGIVVWVLRLRQSGQGEVLALSQGRRIGILRTRRVVVGLILRLRAQQVSVFGEAL